MGHRGKKLGVALGSGAARGLAHIGVLRALADAGMAPEVVAGTSIGALVGGVYAAGKLDAFTDIVLDLDWRKIARYFLEVSFPRSGLIEGLRVSEFIGQIVGKRTIPELPVAFCAVATDVASGREVVIDDGDLVAAIRASIAVPGIFTPARRRNDLLVDGGLVNPVPVSVCRAMGADRVIAVDLNRGRVTAIRGPRPSDPGAAVCKTSRPGATGVRHWLEQRTARSGAAGLGAATAWLERRSGPSIFEVLGNSLAIMEGQIGETRLKIDRPDLLIRPGVGHIQFLEFFLARETIAEGYRAAKTALEEWA